VYRILFSNGGTDQLYCIGVYHSNLTVLYHLGCDAHPSSGPHRALNGGLYSFLCIPVQFASNTIVQYGGRGWRACFLGSGIGLCGGSSFVARTGGTGSDGDKFDWVGESDGVGV
jgi:hypothetical protein